MPPPPQHQMQSNQNCAFQQQHNNLPHSKSLDQYDAAKMHQGNGTINHHHRLSLDQNYKIAQQQAQAQALAQQQQHQQHLSPSQQQQIPSFDYIDVAFNHHPYNQPNSRAPLPYNLSSNLGHTMPSSSSTHDAAGYAYPTFSTNEFYQQQLMQQQQQQQLPTSVSDYHQQQQQHHRSYSDVSPIQDELISFSNEPVRIKQAVPPPTEVKLRSSLKKPGTHCSTSDSVDMEHELNELRALKREKSLTPASTSSEIKSRDGIGNYQAWDYVFQNLEKDLEKQKKNATADEKIAAELENLKVTSNGHGPPRDRHHSHKSNNRLTSVQQTQTASGHTKARTKSVSSEMPASNHEHKRTLSVMESNQRIQMQKPPDLIVGPNEWSCRFCTFLNPNTKKICEMCSKSKDFFLDPDKSSAAAATCV